MGVDLTAIDPLDSEHASDRYYNTVWHALWNIVEQKCADILAPDQREYGASSSGVTIDANQALQIADRMETLIRCGAVHDFATQYAKLIADEFPPKTCSTCNGSGTSDRVPNLPDGRCIACSGRGHRPHSGFEVLFSEEDAKRFVPFARHSGGFRIQ